MLEAPPGADPQHTEPDNATPQPRASLTLLSQLQRRAHPYRQGIYRPLHPDGIPTAGRISPQGEDPADMRPAEGKPGAGLATQRRTAPPLFLPPAEKQGQTPSASGFLGKQLRSKPPETSSAARRAPAAQLEEPEAFRSVPPHRLPRLQPTTHPAEFRCKDSFA